MKRTIILGAGLVGLGVFTAAPAAAQPSSTVSCSPTPQCTIVGQVIAGNIVTQTIQNYAAAPGQTITNYRNLPSDTVSGYQQAVKDTIKNYTGVSVP